MIKILVVEDEIAISRLITMSLKSSGYESDSACDGDEALEKIERETYDLILLDIMLPGVDGFEIMSYIKDRGVPVIFLTAKNSTSDKVKGLKMGAEDYVVKPFEVMELMARIEGVLRRHNKLQTIIKIHGLEINTVSMTVKKSGREIVLTRKEYDILLLFARNPGIVLYKNSIYEHVWGGEYPDDTRTVEIHVQRMRKKVGWNEVLKPVYAVGYRLGAIDE